MDGCEDEGAWTFSSEKQRCRDFSEVERTSLQKKTERTVENIGTVTYLARKKEGERTFRQRKTSGKEFLIGKIRGRQGIF